MPPFVVISADIQPQVVAAVAAPGALSFVETPIAPEQVQAMLERCGLL